MEASKEPLQSLSDNDLLKLRSELQEKLSTAYKARDEAYASLSESIRQLKELHETRRRLIAELKEHRAKRSELIKNVKALREQFKKIRESTSKIYAEVRDTSRKIKALKPLLPRKPADVLEEKILELEWYHQTHSLSLDEEKHMLDELSKLAVQLQALKKYNDLVSLLNELKSQIQANKERMQKLREEISQLSSKIDEHTQAISNIRSELERLSEDIKMKRELIAKAKLQLDKAKNTIKLLKREIYLTDKELERRALLKRAERIANILKIRREKLREKALAVYERFKRGERLSLAEYKLLMEFNLIPIKSSE